MARFINGINNSKGTGRANVATVRKLAHGIPTVILYTIKSIRRGESLLYDYNAGSTTCSYDTSAFIWSLLLMMMFWPIQGDVWGIEGDVWGIEGDVWGIKV